MEYHDSFFEYIQKGILEECRESMGVQKNMKEEYLFALRRGFLEGLQIYNSFGQLWNR